MIIIEFMSTLLIHYYIEQTISMGKQFHILKNEMNKYLYIKKRVKFNKMVISLLNYSKNVIKHIPTIYGGHKLRKH